MSIRVLIADHRMDQLMLLAEFLLRRGVSAATCTDGQQGREAIVSHCEAGEPYDLVIAHVDLPGVAGLRLLYEARSRHLETVAAVSCPRNRRDEKVETMVHKVGVSAVLDQPFDLMQIDGLIKKLLASRGLGDPGTGTHVPDKTRVSAVIYRDEQSGDDGTELPDMDSGRGPPPPSATGTHRMPPEDDVALPSFSGAPTASPPANEPEPENYTKRVSAFYDPSGQLVEEAGFDGHGPDQIDSGDQRSGYRRRSSTEIPAPPASGGGQAPGYTRRASGEFFDANAARGGTPPTTGYTRRHSSEFFDAGATRPAKTTKRIRRSLSGSFGPPPDTNVATTCGHCGKAYSVKAIGKPVDAPCPACGGLNRVDT